MQQTLNRFVIMPLIIAVAASCFALVLTPAHSLAVPQANCANPKDKTACNDQAISTDCTQATKDNCDLIAKYVNPGVNLLSVMFGLIAVISLIAGGIQYSSSGGDSQKVTQAKNRIANTLFAIVAYFFLYAFLQFLIPGGIFNR